MSEKKETEAMLVIRMIWDGMKTRKKVREWEP